jgi:uncharacterized protein
MGAIIRIEIGETALRAELNESETAILLLETLPATLTLSRWGEEYYGACGVAFSDEHDAREIMEVGELAYWQPGSAFCVFFGPTPASTDGRPKAASPVVPIGRILDDPSPLRSMGSSITAVLTTSIQD